jgi:hypothetical protein
MAVPVQITLIICGTILAIMIVTYIGESISNKKARKDLHELVEKWEKERTEDENS